MTQTTSEGVVATTGNIISFPVGSTIVYGVNGVPANSVEHGYTSEDGVQISGDRSNTNILTWQNSQVMRTVTTEASKTFQFTLYQTNDDNLELAYGVARNSVTGGVHVNAGQQYPHKSWFIDAIDTATMKKVRYYLPDAQVTSVGDQQLAAGNLISYDITLTAYAVEVEGELANYVIFDGDYTTGS